MALKYPEKVFARMIRLIDNDEILFIRKDTEIQFGNSKDTIGIAIMTNPGSFKFRDSKDWRDFESGQTSYNVFEAQDKPDLTMQNIIKVVREGFSRSYLDVPNGIVKIYNISNIVEPNRELVEDKHKKVLHMIQKDSVINVNHLVEPVTNDEYEFVKACSNVDFIIMGFADNIFKSHISNIIEWAANPAIKEKLVFGKDNKGRFSHPRRWRTETYLMDKAIESLVDVLSQTNKYSFKTGYTFLRWNGKYGGESKFIVRDNESNLQALFTPGRVQDIIFTKIDLVNAPDFREWKIFGNERETVADLGEVAF